MGGCLILNVNGVGGVSEGPSPNPDGGKPFGFRPLCPPQVVWLYCLPSPGTKRWAKPCFQKMTISIGGVLRF